MAKIYRYIDMRDNFIKYVGIVYGENRTLEQRHKEHLKKDIWCDENFKVQYLDVPINSRSEAEALEAHFISLYQTGSWYNKSKSNWGQSSFVPKFNERDWQNFYYSLTQQDLENINNKRNHLINKNIDNSAINDENVKYISDKLDQLIKANQDLNENIDIIIFGKLLNIEKKVSDSVNETLQNGIRFNFSKEVVDKIKESFREVLVANMDPFVNMYTKNQTRWAWVFILLFLILFIILIKK